MNEIRKCDIFMAVVVIMSLGIHMMTNFYMSLKSTETKADIEDVVMVYETNVFTRIQMWSDKILNMVFFMIKPAIAMFFYWLVRKSHLKGKTELIVLQSYVMVCFFILIVNFLNDFSILAGLLAKGVI